VADRGELHEALRRWLDVPMLVLSLGFLVVLLWPLADPHLPARTQSGLNDADYGIWAAFAIEYVALVATAPQRRRYVLHHIPDLLMVVLPMLRPLRILRVVRASAAVVVTGRRSRQSFYSRAPLYAASTAVLVVLCASAMVLRAERTDRHANIHGFGDAVWWSVTTITTVGYGDRYPVTAAGRALAVVLMLTGIALLGVITASLAAWLVSTEEHSQRALADEVRDLREAVATLTMELQQREDRTVGNRST
jgi:voltage-gated potassium channel